MFRIIVPLKKQLQKRQLQKQNKKQLIAKAQQVIDSKITPKLFELADCDRDEAVFSIKELRVDAKTLMMISSLLDGQNLQTEIQYDQNTVKPDQLRVYWGKLSNVYGYIN